MRQISRAIGWAALAAFLLSARTASPQSGSRDAQITAVVQQLFVAMKASDTAATRSAFVANGRVIPVQLQETTAGWKIVTMAFTSVTQGCPSHPAP
jgi:starvation-inducible outer membrane lipoprotein